jgi:hypothetical protein
MNVFFINNIRCRVCVKYNMSRGKVGFVIIHTCYESRSATHSATHNFEPTLRDFCNLCSQVSSLGQSIIQIIMPRRRQHKMPPVHGREIRFVRGTYKGCNGWVDTANKTKRGWVWVVVDDKDYEEEVHARVWKSSVREIHKAPTNWAEAAIQQHPEIEFAIIEVSRMFATCTNLDDTVWPFVVDVLGKEIKLAKLHVGNEIKKTTRVVNFNA